jgi:hypothetical protein
MPANRFGIDVGELYRTKENIQSARTRNKLASLQLSEAEREVAQRPIKEQRAQEKNRMLTGLRQKAVTGDIDAQQQLLAIDPEGGASFIESVGKMDDRKLKVAQQKVDEMGQMAATVLNASPEKQARLYQQMLTTLPPESVAKMPKELDLDFLEISLSKAMAMDKILENPKAVQVGGEDIVYQRGKEIARGKRPVKKSGTGDGRGIKTSDESAMSRQVATLYGGMYNPKTGKFQMTDPKVLPEIQAVLEQATVYYRDDKSLTAAQAVSKAAKDFGVKIPTAEGDQQYTEGQRAKDAAGNILVYTNGQWVPEQ